MSAKDRLGVRRASPGKAGKMRKTIILAMVMVLALALAGTAYAATFAGTRGDNTFVGMDRGDRAVMRAGDDQANGKG